MRIHYPKLRNMTHAMSLSVFIAFKGSNFFIFIQKLGLPCLWTYGRFESKLIRISVEKLKFFTFLIKCLDFRA